MKILPFLALTTFAVSPVLAEETRQLDAHEHGVGQLNIAFDGSKIAMELEAPGADIVGFEYEAKSDADLAAIDAAIAKLGDPLSLFEISSAAGCSVVDASAELESEEDHDDHEGEGHDDHADEDKHDDHDDHKDDDHADHKDDDHDDHKDEDHAEHKDDDHDDHKDEDHADHKDDDHDDHAEDGEEAGHTEFHAEYLLDCKDVDAVKGINFAYFAAFPNALEVEVKVLTDTGATAFEVEKDAPMLDLSSLK